MSANMTTMNLSHAKHIFLIAFLAFVVSCESKPYTEHDNGGQPEQETAAPKYISVDVDALSYGPRESTKSFQITCVSNKDISVSILLPKPILYRGLIKGLQSTGDMHSGAGVICFLKPGESQYFTLEVEHHEPYGLDEGVIQMFASVTGDGRPETQVINIPLSIETSAKSFHADLFGRVTDTAGNPLEGILIYCDCVGFEHAVRTDADGRYRFDSIPRSSEFTVYAYSERHYQNESGVIDYKIADFEVNLKLKPCPHHLTLSRSSVDFGTGSISESGPDSEWIYVDVEADTDEWIQYTAKLHNPEFGVVPGLHYSADGIIDKAHQFSFQLSRAYSIEGEHHLIYILRTSSAGTYILPITFTNTP